MSETQTLPVNPRVVILHQVHEDPLPAGAVIHAFRLQLLVDHLLGRRVLHAANLNAVLHFCSLIFFFYDKLWNSCKELLEESCCFVKLPN